MQIDDEVTVRTLTENQRLDDSVKISMSEMELSLIPLCKSTRLCSTSSGSLESFGLQLNAINRSMILRNNKSLSSN